ncbi:uncharacterized protein TNCV_4996951 [Trichonephila clavipes]|nr:uncharacterized protein TNCV_4996951 [Trichonephila clavipes]
MATSTSKTAAFGVKLIHKCMSKRRYIQKNLLFGALYGLVESFFKNDEGHNVTVNGDRYRAMITNFFIPELNNHDVQELWFQQDGATCHTARATIDVLKDTFGDRLISRFGPVNWPPRSCDLTPLDYFLWGYVKSLVYADKPQTLDHLEYNIRRVIADIRPQMLEKVIENWTSRLDYIRASRGSHMPEIIFKIFINIHAPTEDKDGVEKELFYEELHALYASCLINVVKIILGDANAKIGTEKEFRQIVGKSSLCDLSNDNEKRLIHFAADHNMVVPSTMFQHKNIHKITWRSPDGSTCNQINHFLVDSRHKSHTLDVRTYRRANLDSDHFLVMAKVRARISNF